MGILTAEILTMQRAALAIRQHSQTLRDSGLAVQAGLLPLLASWQGGAAMGFETELASCVLRMAKAPGMLDGLAGGVRQAADAFEAAEQELLRLIDTSVVFDGER
jgi:WXG100 family type VII secretion target